MNSRIRKLFLNNKKNLITFVTGGDPDLKTSLNIIKNLPKYGADLIEIGMPFSDPMADGPTIQASSNRAIKNNTKLDDIFKICRSFRKKNDSTPIILMGYYNLIYFYGIKNFVQSCKKYEVDGLIIVDLQPEEDPELLEEIKFTNIDLIRLITPTTDINRLKVILKNASGFLYYVTITGITGQNSANMNDLKKSVNNIRKHTNLPIVCGFGINNSKQVKEICNFSNGAVVGSSIIKIIEKNKDKKQVLSLISRFVNNLKRGILS